jgi:hypothetical protein
MNEELYGFLISYCVMCKMLKINVHNANVSSQITYVCFVHITLAEILSKLSIFWEYFMKILR